MGGCLERLCCCRGKKTSIRKRTDRSSSSRIPKQKLIELNEDNVYERLESVKEEEKTNVGGSIFNCDNHENSDDDHQLDNSLTKKLLSDCCDTFQHVVRVQKSTSLAEIKNEIEQSLASAISDRATDEVLEALTRYRRGMGISDSPSVLLDEPQTPDIVRSRSSHDTEGMIIRPGRSTNLPKLGMESPTATPHMLSKRRSIARKVRPQSVVENLSLGHIPDLLESPSSRRSNAQMSSSSHDPHGNYNTTASGNDCSIQGDDYGVDECCDSITELPSASFQLQHLVKGRPKRAKTRAPTRPLVNVDGAGVSAAKEIGEGLEQFFRPGSVTPTTLTPLVSPTSDECSSLSFVDSPTMSRDGNGQMTSEETTPILEERRPMKLERASPLLKGGPWTTRSRSTDNLEKYSPLVGRKSPLVKMRTEGGGAVGASGDVNDDSNGNGNAGEHLLKATDRHSGGKMRSPSSDSIRSQAVENNSNAKTGNGILRTPIVQKPRPWSIVGSEPKGDSTKTTPEKLDEENEVAAFGKNVSIIPISTGNVKGVSLEKKSVRELAAGLSRMDLPMKPQVLPRTLLSSATSTSNINESHTSSESSTTTLMATQTTTVLSTQQKASSSEPSEVLTKTIVTENTKNTGSSANHSTKTSNNVILGSMSNIGNHIISIRNGKLASNNSTSSASHSTNSSSSSSTVSSTTSKMLVSEKASAFVGSNASDTSMTTTAGLKRVAGRDITKIFEETLVEGLQRSSTRRTLRDTYNAEDIVDV